MINVILSGTKKIIIWINNNRLEFGLLVFIFVISLFLRLYRIGDYMTFLGDEGRDMVIVRRLLVDHNLVFVGPGTSVGNMYLGPLYYYLIAPFLLLFNYSPVGPSVMVAIFGSLTVIFVWFAVRSFFGEEIRTKKVAWDAILAAFLYATSPTAIIFSHSSWNPNIMPFFATMVIFSLWQIWGKNRMIWLLPLGISFAITLQSHYMAFILLPVILFFWTLTLIDLLKNKKKLVKKFAALSFAQVIAFVAVMSPLILFDYKHGWRNLMSMQTFFAAGRDNLSFSLVRVLVGIPDAMRKVVVSLFAGRSQAFAPLVYGVLIAFAVWLLFIDRSKYSKDKLHAYFLVSGWLVVGILGLSFYRLSIYDHYFEFMFPALFILLGGILQDINSKPLLHKALGVVLCGLLFVPNLLGSPLKDAPNKQLKRSIDVSRKIVEESGGTSFNLAVIADNNYEGAYQYFFELWGVPLFQIDPQRYQETLANQLFVVCEYEDITKCQPTSNPKAEVANFGWSKIDAFWRVDGLMIYKLVHNYSGK